MFPVNAILNHTKHKQRMHNIALKKHLSMLKHLEKENPPLFVSFIGAPGMGKTTIAKALEDPLEAIRITIDDVPPLLGGNPKIKAVIKHLEALLYIIRTTSKNKLIILDSRLDEASDTIAETILQRYSSVPLFMIQVHTDTSLATDRVKRRGGKNAAWIVENMDRFYQAYKAFDVYPIDYHIDNNNDNFCISIDPLINAIQERLTQYGRTQT